MRAAKASIDSYLAIKPDQYAGMNMSLMMLFGQSVQFLYRLSILEDSGWDRDLARQTVDTVRCLEQGAERLEAASELAVLVDNGPAQKLFSRAASGLRSSIPIWRTALEQPVQPIATDIPGALNFDASTAGPALMDFSDVMWFEDTFPSWQ